jgi:hypothetical protein
MWSGYVHHVPYRSAAQLRETGAMELLLESYSGEDKNGERIQGSETSIQAHFNSTVPSVHETPIDTVCHTQLRFAFVLRRFR